MYRAPNLLPTLRPTHMKLTLIGGILLAVGLITPWYYYAGNEYYSMSAVGGSFVDSLQNTVFFNPLAAYISLCFAVLSTLLPFISLKIPLRSQAKYAAGVSLLTGISALMNIVYIHFWLNQVNPDTPFMYYGSETSWGPTVGYFLTWVAAVLLFVSTYISQGLSQEPTKIRE